MSTEFLVDSQWQYRQKGGGEFICCEERDWLVECEGLSCMLGTLREQHRVWG